MKVGMRKPSIKKSVKARTTGKVKRAVKKSVNPTYGKKGMGMINDPKKAVYNKVYNKTTFSAKDAVDYVNSGSNDYKLDADELDTLTDEELEDYYFSRIKVDMNKVNEPNTYYTRLARKFTLDELISKRKIYSIIGITCFLIYWIAGLLHRNDICPYFSLLTIIFGVLTWRRHRTIEYLNKKDK